MPTNVLVPRLGEGVEEVTVTKWLKAVGESVKELEPLLEVNTDKVDTEIPAPASGVVLKIVAEEGVPAKVGAILAFIGKPGENVEVSGGQVSSVRTPVVEKTPVKENLTPESSHMTREIGFISPVVAKVAAEHGVNLSEVQGTGLNGRITKNDVLTFVEGQRSKVQGQIPQPATFQPLDKLRTPPSNIKPIEGDQLIKHTVIRKQIAEHMVMSKHTSPHVLTVMEADMSRVARHRSTNKRCLLAMESNLISLLIS